MCIRRSLQPFKKGQRVKHFYIYKLGESETVSAETLLVSPA